MTLCNLLRPNCLGAPYPWARLAVRWSSYDAASLTRDSLLRELESGLGEDAEGKALQIDADAKTVTTAAGPLPISPLFDPDWMKSRRRQKKSDPGPTVGRFRRKLANNPYGQSDAPSQPNVCFDTGALILTAGSASSRDADTQMSPDGCLTAAIFPAGF